MLGRGKGDSPKHGNSSHHGKGGKLSNGCRETHVGRKVGRDKNMHKKETEAEALIMVIAAGELG